MGKEEILKNILEVLQRLEKEEHVTDLANNKRYEEVAAVLAEVDYDLVNEWLGYIKNEAEYQLDVSDIPEEYRVPFAILLTEAEYNDDDVFKDYDEFAKDLKQRGAAGELMALLLKKKYINYLHSFEKFMETCEGVSGALKNILEVLQRLEKEEHVTDLANDKQYEEVAAVLAEVDYDLVNEWLGYIKGKAECKLDISYIPEEYRLPFAILLTEAKYDDTDVFEDCDEFEEDLKQRGAAGELMAEFSLSGKYINGYHSFKKFMEACEDFAK